MKISDFILLIVLCLLVVGGIGAWRLVDRGYALALREGESVHGRVLQLERARQGGEGTAGLVIFLSTAVGLSLVALSVRLALGGDGLVGVLKQVRGLRRSGTKGRGQGQRPRQEADIPPRLVVHPPDRELDRDAPRLSGSEEDRGRDGIEWT